VAGDAGSACQHGRRGKGVARAGIVKDGVGVIFTIRISLIKNDSDPIYPGQ